MAKNGFVNDSPEPGRRQSREVDAARRRNAARDDEYDYEDEGDGEEDIMPGAGTEGKAKKKMKRDDEYEEDDDDDMEKSMPVSVIDSDWLIPVIQKAVAVKIRPVMDYCYVLEQENKKLRKAVNGRLDILTKAVDDHAVTLNDLADGQTEISKALNVTTATINKAVNIADAADDADRKNIKRHSETRNGSNGNGNGKEKVDVLDKSTVADIDEVLGGEKPRVSPANRAKMPVLRKAMHEANQRGIAVEAIGNFIARTSVTNRQGQPIGFDDDDVLMLEKGLSEAGLLS
jgi:hypothetical protein